MSFKPTPQAGVFSLDDLIQLRKSWEKANDKFHEAAATPKLKPRLTLATATKEQVQSALHKAFKCPR